MGKSISIYNNKSLSELGWQSDEPLAFMDKNEEIYLSVADGLIPGKAGDSGFELKFNFWENIEDWVLYPHGKVLLLKSPIVSEYNTRYLMYDIRYLGPGDNEGRTAPTIEKACAGKDEIIKMINESDKMKYYSSAISNGRMVLGRTGLENFLSCWGLDFVLPNPVRIKGL